MRYRNTSSGRFISAKEVRTAVDSIIDREALTMRGIAQDLIAGRINLAEFQLRMSTNVKRLNVSMAIAGSGGVNATSAADYGYIGSLVKRQYQFLRGMAEQIKSGEQKLDGTLMTRVALYAQSSRDTFEQMRQHAAKANGKSQYRNLIGVADHCPECLSETARGWVPIGSLIPVGQRLCKSNCHCSLAFR